MTMLPLLPPQFDHDNPRLLRQTVAAVHALGELKGAIATIPNKEILLDTLLITEARSSNAIENIITTYDELYISNTGEKNVSPSTKEAQNYIEAVKHGHMLLKQNQLLTINNIVAIQKINSPNHGEIRKIPGTVLKNEQSGETVYTPPQDYDKIIELLRNLEIFINDSDFSDLYPLIKMAIIHYQFESIHPFYDGNGRMGRILNILYLAQQKLISVPVLYLSKFIIEHKTEYYALFQKVRDAGDWLSWCIWLIKGVEEIATGTVKKINQIKTLMDRYTIHIKAKYKFYSQDLINVLFRYPYTKIEFIEKN